VGSPGSFGSALILIVLAGLRSMESSKEQPLQPGPHLPSLWAGPGSYLLLRQAQERTPLGQAMEAGAGRGEKGITRRAGPRDQRLRVLGVRGGHI